MAESYRLLSYRAERGARAGVAIGDAVFDAAALTGRADYVTVLDLLADWPAADKLLRKPPGSAKQLAAPKVLAPVLYPSAVYCAGANYADHMLEMAAAAKAAPEPDPHELGLGPWHFIKAPRAIVGDGDIVTLPRYARNVDWEIELAAVIGRPARNVPLERALDYVAGYTIANDLSARDAGRRGPVPDLSPFKWDWTSHKSFEGSCPLGPWIVPASDIPDPQALGLKLWINDVIKQDSHTSKMIFTTAEQIAHLSTRITLHPGDLVLTGTPAGVGAGRGEFLKAGDVVKLWIEKIGTLTNTCA
ncbi:MAG: fumarylacetoacetate hydrolase family protein [Proteobacteria bacterium]|nr:fumarylacetoacetate hydrolase family protein [Pseudomonadota bacterium]